MKITTFGVDQFEVKNKTIQRLHVKLRVVDTDPVPTLDLSKIRVGVTLNRNGKNIPIFNSSLDILCRESMYFEVFDVLLVPFTYQVAANTYLIPLVIDLGSVINVMDGDVLTTEIDAQSGWYGDASTNPALCYLIADWQERIGKEIAIPTINTKVLKAGEDTFSDDLGHNITSITVVNTDSLLPPTDSSKIVDSFIIDSDRYKINHDMDSMLARRMTQFPSLNNGSLRGKTFKYVPETEIDDCSVKLKLIAGNVALSKNHLVWRQMIWDQNTSDRAIRLAQKHEERDAAKVLKAYKK